MQSCDFLFEEDICELSKNSLNATLKEMMACLKAECGSLFLFDPRTQELVLNRYYNPRVLPIDGLRRRIGQGVSGKVVRLKEAVLVKDIGSDNRFRRNGFKHYRTGSFLSIPLFVRDSVIGIINIGDKADGGRFSEQDLEFCVTLARYSCRIIEQFKDASKIWRGNEKLTLEKSYLERYAAVGKMASGIVHELSNPLDGMIRFAGILSSSLDHDSPGAGYLAGIRSGLDSIRNITLSLLNFGRQFPEAPVPAGDRADVNELLDSSLFIFQHKMGDRVRLIRKYRKNLPPVRAPGLQQVFINLFKNSLAAMDGSGELIVRTALKKNKLMISIKDNGCGMLPEVREHIFEPFFTTKGVEEGTGLGLSICKEIIEKLNGQISVCSRPGRGTEFTLLISCEEGGRA